MASAAMPSETDCKADLPKDTLFPLPLTGFEKFLLWDDEDQHSYGVFFQVNFDSLLEDARLERAIHIVLEHHPLLTARVIDQNGQPLWIPGEEHPVLFDLTSHPPLIEGRARPIDLRREPAIRFWHIKQDGRSQILLQYHHAASDGLPIRQLLIDIAQQYSLLWEGDKNGREDHGQQPSRSTLFYRKFVRDRIRDRSDYSHLGKPKRAISAWQRLKNAYYFHFQTPTALRGHPEQTTAHDHQPLVSLKLPKDVTEAGSEKARRSGYAVSQLSVATMFRTCALWNQQHGDNNPRARIRLLIPYDLRCRKDLRMSSANKMTFVFMGRTYSQCQDIESLLESVHRESVAIQETQLGMDFLSALELAHKYPRLMRWIMKKSPNMATAVVNYSGDVLRGVLGRYHEHADSTAGPVRLQSAFAAPPVRSNTNLSLCLLINFGQIYLTATHNPKGLSRSECEQFLRLYSQQWQSYAEA